MSALPAPSQHGGDEANAVKRRALVRVFNRYASVVGGARSLTKQDLHAALAELGFFSVYPRNQADALIGRLLAAMGGAPVKLDSFVHVMAHSTSARPAAGGGHAGTGAAAAAGGGGTGGSTTPQRRHPGAGGAASAVSPPPPPPPPHPPSPVAGVRIAVPARVQDARSPSPNWGGGGGGGRGAAASEERHEQRVAKHRNAFAAATAAERASMRRGVSLSAVSPAAAPASGTAAEDTDDSAATPDGWVQKTVPYPEVPPEQQMVAVAAVAVPQPVVKSPLTHLPLLPLSALPVRAQRALASVGGGWPARTAPAVHGTALCVGERVLLVGDSVVHLLTGDGCVDHCVPVANVSGVYTADDGHVGLECRSSRGLMWQGEEGGHSEALLKTILEAACARQGAMNLQITYVRSLSRLTALIRADLPTACDMPVTFYVPDTAASPPPAPGSPLYRAASLDRRRAESPEKDTLWLEELQARGKTGFVVDATWEARRYRISMPEGSIGAVRVGSIKATLSKWVGVPVEELTLYSPAGAMLPADDVLAEELGVVPGDVFSLTRLVRSPELSVMPSPLRGAAALDETGGSTQVVALSPSAPDAPDAAAPPQRAVSPPPELAAVMAAHRARSPPAEEEEDDEEEEEDEVAAYARFRQRRQPRQMQHERQHEMQEEGVEGEGAASASPHVMVREVRRVPQQGGGGGGQPLQPLPSSAASSQLVYSQRPSPAVTPTQKPVQPPTRQDAHNPVRVRQTHSQQSTPASQPASLPLRPQPAAEQQQQQQQLAAHQPPRHNTTTSGNMMQREQARLQGGSSQNQQARAQFAQAEAAAVPQPQQQAVYHVQVTHDQAVGSRQSSPSGAAAAQYVPDAYGAPASQLTPQQPAAPQPVGGLVFQQTPQQQQQQAAAEQPHSTPLQLHPHPHPHPQQQPHPQQSRPQPVQPVVTGHPVYDAAAPIPLPRSAQQQPLFAHPVARHGASTPATTPLPQSQQHRPPQQQQQPQPQYQAQHQQQVYEMEQQQQQLQQQFQALQQQQHQQQHQQAAAAVYQQPAEQPTASSYHSAKVQQLQQQFQHLQQAYPSGAVLEPRGQKVVFASQAPPLPTVTAAPPKVASVAHLSNIQSEDDVGLSGGENWLRSVVMPGGDGGGQAAVITTVTHTQQQQQQHLQDPQMYQQQQHQRSDAPPALHDSLTPLHQANVGAARNARVAASPQPSSMRSSSPMATFAPVSSLTGVDCVDGHATFVHNGPPQLTSAVGVGKAVSGGGGARPLGRRNSNVPGPQAASFGALQQHMRPHDVQRNHHKQHLAAVQEATRGAFGAMGSSIRRRSATEDGYDDGYPGGGHGEGAAAGGGGGGGMLVLEF